MRPDEMIKGALGAAKSAAGAMTAAADPGWRAAGQSLIAILGVVEALITDLGPVRALERLRFLAAVSRAITDEELERDEAGVLEKLRAEMRARSGRGA